MPSDQIIVRISREAHALALEEARERKWTLADYLTDVVTRAAGRKKPGPKGEPPGKVKKTQ